MARELRPCGTVAAYVRHLRHGEEPCDDCRKANNDAQNSNPRAKAYQRARIRALGHLALIYDATYRALLDEELAKEEDYR